MTCLNCRQKFEGQFCPNCGQKSQTKRLTFISVIKDFMEALSDSDRGFLKTVIDLSQNPGKMLNDYIAGKRQRYLSAGKYTFFLVIIFTVTLSSIEHRFGWFEKMTKGIDHIQVSGSVNNKKNEPVAKTLTFSKQDLSDNSQTEIASPLEDTFHIDIALWGKKIDRRVKKDRFFEWFQELLPHYHRTLFDYLKILIILWIPIFSFFSYLMFFKSPYNFAEHITINSYIYAHILLIFTFLSPLYWFMPQLSGTTLMTSFTAGFFFIIYSYMQVFLKRSHRLLKTLASLSLSFFTYIMVLSALISTVAAYIAVQNIDSL